MIGKEEKGAWHFCWLGIGICIIAVGLLLETGRGVSQPLQRVADSTGASIGRLILGYYWLGILALLAVLTRYYKRDENLLQKTFNVVGLSLFIAEAIKKIASVLGGSGDFLGFPSEDAAIAFSFFLSISFSCKYGCWVNSAALLFPGLIGWSSLEIGVYDVPDLLAGLGIGLIGSVLVLPKERGISMPSEGPQNKGVEVKSRDHGYDIEIPDWIPTRLGHLFWDIEFLKDNRIIRSAEFSIPKEDKGVRYPFRILRYWFMYHLIRREFLLRNTPLAVCELGVDKGQMLHFMRAAGQNKHTEIKWSEWVAVDLNSSENELAQAGYTDYIKGDIGDPSFSLPRQYDVVILLHILEHLCSPESIFENLIRYVRDGGILIGGSPVLPHRLASLRENKIRKTARNFGHVSVFSPTRVRAMAEKNNLELTFLTGAFLMRSKGFFLENFAWWMRLNLFFGALTPWHGETYWMMRKSNPKIPPPKSDVKARSENEK